MEGLRVNPEYEGRGSPLIYTITHGIWERTFRNDLVGHRSSSASLSITCPTDWFHQVVDYLLFG
jgi:hypothetical protein